MEAPRASGEPFQITSATIYNAFGSTDRLLQRRHDGSSGTENKVYQPGYQPKPMVLLQLVRCRSVAPIRPMVPSGSRGAGAESARFRAITGPARLQRPARLAEGQPRFQQFQLHT